MERLGTTVQTLKDSEPLTNLQQEDALKRLLNNLGADELKNLTLSEYLYFT